MIKYLREMSDLHLEFGTYQIQPLDTDKDTILLLAGDIHVKEGVFKNDWMKQVSEQFAHVVYILGNHEHYRSSIDKTGSKIKQGLIDHNLTNVTVLENEVFEIPELKIKILGGTMWTDYNKGNPITMNTAANSMNDHHYIRQQNGSQKFLPKDALKEHLKFKTFLKEELVKEYDGTYIVMTHHLPHQLCIHPQYAHDFHGNGSYVSDLSEIVLDNPKIKQWFSGHTHSSCRFSIGECQIIVNPRGYFPSDLNDEFDPVLLLKL